MVAVHGLTMMHSAHNLMTMMMMMMIKISKEHVSNHADGDKLDDNSIESSSPDEADERAESVEDISIISTRLVTRFLHHDFSCQGLS